MNNRTIKIDLPTTTNDKVIEVSLSYRKPDTSYWNPNTPNGPYYSLSVMPITLDRRENGLVWREYKIFAGEKGGIRYTFPGPARFNAKKLKDEFDVVRQSEVYKRMLQKVLEANGLVLEEAKVAA